MTGLLDFGLTDYATVWDLQKRLVEDRLADACEDVVLIGEHPPVYTSGRRSQLSEEQRDVLDPTIPVVDVERGGELTYHGPGQLIAYPILKLPEGRRDLRRYLRDLEEVLILTLRDFELEGTRREGWTGVWVSHPVLGEKKIASIGVAVKKWVTYHGLALNVNTQLQDFSAINPCGLTSDTMTSLSALLGRPVKMAEVKAALTRGFETVFQTRLRPHKGEAESTYQPSRD